MDIVDHARLQVNSRFSEFGCYLAAQFARAGSSLQFQKLPNIEAPWIAWGFLARSKCPLERLVFSGWVTMTDAKLAGYVAISSSGRNILDTPDYSWNCLWFFATNGQQMPWDLPCDRQPRLCSGNPKNEIRHTTNAACPHRERKRKDLHGWQYDSVVSPDQSKALELEMLNSTGSDLAQAARQQVYAPIFSTGQAEKRSHRWQHWIRWAIT